MILKQLINHKIWFYLLAFVLLSYCGNDDDIVDKPQSTSINKIMPLGASRVEGARPEFESYRYELWKKLLDSNWVFDYIGTMSDEVSYPNYNNKPFDIDHEGRGGWTSAEILEGLPGWLGSIGKPDVVLFSSPGGNDILSGENYVGMMNNIEAIIKLLQSNNPRVNIIIELMAPGHSDFMTEEYTENFVKNRADVIQLAEKYTKDSSQVLTVDMYSGFSDDMLADDVHYNEKGAQFIGLRYYEVLKNILEK